MKSVLLLLCCLMVTGLSPVNAATIGYVPMDDRPVNLEYVTDTVKAAGTTILSPPVNDIAGRDRKGDTERLWEWLFDHAARCDAMALSSDSMVYGGLVSSRTHFASEKELAARVEKFRELKRRHPALRLYVFGTIMRTPKMSAGATEPPYYEIYGPTIFRITSLEDKRETAGLSTPESVELKQRLAEVPRENMMDWRARRAKNVRVNERLLEFAREGVFEHMVLGRDDSSPLSASHQEYRHLEQAATGLGPERYLSIPGADNLGMSMVVHAINDSEFRLPFVKVFYAGGAGGATVATYEDRPLQETVPQHIIVSGGVKLDLADRPDLVLAVNTPVDGRTREAGQEQNVPQPNKAVLEFVSRVARDTETGARVAVADVSFANGSDNSLMAELGRQGLLDRLAAYSGWNTAGNTIGYAVGQGMLSASTPEVQRKKLLAVRYLDDWAYQANIRKELAERIVYPAGNDGQRLNALKPGLTREAAALIRKFASEKLWGIPLENIGVEFPWNRMFEIGVHIR